VTLRLLLRFVSHVSQMCLTLRFRPGDHLRSFGVRTEGSSGRRVVADAFIPIYPNTLPTVPKPSKASRTASLVVNNLEASQSAITRLLNRCTGQNLYRGFESPPLRQKL